MSKAIVYNIPARQIEAYRGHDLIVRSAVLSEVAYCLETEPERIRFAQLLCAPSDTSVLEGAGESLPIEIALKDPAADYVRLYNYENLLDTHPVRIAVPVLPGFGKAVKLAVSLNFAVKLELEQPDDFLIEELETVLDLYLHRQSVRHPIEFFQTTLQSFFQGLPISLWEIAEEEPARVRYITDDGEETISKRFAGTRLEGSLDDFVERFGQELVSEKRECHECEFFSRCGGYFKWPDKNYKCDGVKRVFRTLAGAAAEMKQDLAAYEVMGAQQQS